MKAARGRRGDDAHMRRVERRREQQDAANEKYRRRANDPLTKEIAFGICAAVYCAPCACAKRPDMDACGAMTAAALGAIRRVRQHGAQPWAGDDK